MSHKAFYAALSVCLVLAGCSIKSKHSKKPAPKAAPIGDARDVSKTDNKNPGIVPPPVSSQPAPLTPGSPTGPSTPATPAPSNIAASEARVGASFNVSNGAATIVALNPEGLLASLQFEAGDVILAIDGKSFADAEGFATLIVQAEGLVQLEIRNGRDGTTISVPLDFAANPGAPQDDFDDKAGQNPDDNF